MASKRHSIRTIKIDPAFCEKLKRRCCDRSTLREYMGDVDGAYVWWVIKLGTAEKILRGSYKIRRSVAEKLANTYQVAFVIKNNEVFKNLIDKGTPLDDYWRIKIANGKGGFYAGTIKNCTGAFEMPLLETCIYQANVVIDGKIKICTKCGNVVRNAYNKCPRAIQTKNVRTCYSCGNALTRKETKYGICEDCRRRDVNRRRSYHDWGEMPRFSLPSRRDRYLHLGMELEMHSRFDEYDDDDRTPRENSVAYLTKGMGEIVNKDVWKPFWHFERDSSLNNGGVECISEPLTLGNFKKNMPMIQEALDFAMHNGGYVNERAGIHIHIDRNFFEKHSRYASLKLAYLVEMWSGLFRIVAQRGETDYCQRYGIATNDDCIVAYDKMRNDAGHHSAVNIGNNGTIELRIFKSSFNTNEIMMYLDVTSALAKMAKNIAYERLGNCEFEELAKYLTYRETITTMDTVGVPSSKIDKMYEKYDKKHGKK